jgi:Ca2+-dependent lipid-binding protein
VAIKKPVGILHVNVVRAHKLLKMDIVGSSDPYVKLSLTGDSLPAKKTTIKKNNLNPEWHEKFKLIVKDPQTQVLRIEVYDWDKVFPVSLFNCFEKWRKGKKKKKKSFILFIDELC